MLFLATGLLALGAAPLQDFRDEGALVRPPRVRAFVSDGREWFDVQAQNTQAAELLKEIARAAKREIRGLEALAAPTLLTIELRGRSLDQVLEYVLGGIGLRHELEGRAFIHVVDTPPASTDELLDIATASWMRATRQFPDHPAAAEARLALGEIAERRDLLGAARDNYLALAEDYPNSTVIGEAYMRAGRISAVLGQWGEASRLFRTLAALEAAPEYAAPARLEWARAMIAQGDPQAALYMLSHLDSEYPATDRTEITARRLVRARALNETRRYAEALREIDMTDGDFDSFGAWEALHVRAVALEGVGLPSEAARAWLVFAREAKREDKDLAYREAARLSLKAQDELAVLFIVQQGELAGVTEGLDRFERIARERLGLSLASDGESIQTRVGNAEQWIEEGDFTSAAAVLQPVFLGRGALDDLLDARVCVAWAQCVNEQAGLEPAIDLLRAARPEMGTPEARQRLDVGAAKLFEIHRRFDDAVAAYQGTYAKP